MSERGKAVFLSYASQDADAARTICEALRAVGVEVWFDQKELRGGDAWDGKIRRQIRECTLFLPIISANTQARREGYFRLEWRLADQRTHLMGRTAAFVLPVCIDNTPNQEADVPDSFLAVQWSRLPDGRVSGDFAEHVKNLLACGDPQVTPAPFQAMASAPPTTDPFWTRPPPAKVSPPRRTWPWLAAAAAALLVIAAMWWPRERAADNPARAVTPTKAEARPAAAHEKSTAATEKSLVVLPLENLSPDPENAFFTDGMHAEIIATLQAVPELKVLSREAALALKVEGGSARDIARRAGVAHVLAGSVRREGTKVRVLLDLRRVSDDAILWSAPKVTRELKEALSLQAEVAEEVARILRARFDKGAFAGLRFLATDPRAYDAYLKAFALYQQNPNRPPAILQAVALMEEGMKIDPKFMPGARLLGRMCVRLYLIVADVAQLEKYAEQAKMWSELASSLVPGGAGDSSLAFYYGAVEQDSVRSRSYAENTVRVLPNDFEGHHYLGLAMRGLGRVSEALPHLEKSITLDPPNSPSWNALLESLAYLRRGEAFHTWLDKYRATHPEKPLLADFVNYRFCLDGSLPATMENVSSTRARSAWLWRTRQFDELVRLTSAWLGANAAANQNTVMRLAWQCDALRWLGREPEAMAAARQLEQIVQQLHATPERDPTAKPRRLATAAARLGRTDEAIRAAQRAIAACDGPEAFRRWAQELALAEIYAYAGRARESVELIAKLLGVPCGLTVPRLKVDPLWDRVRDDPAFKALLADPKNSAPL